MPMRHSSPAGPGPRAHTVVDSPLGPLTLVAEGVALAGLYMAGQRHRPPQESFGPRREGLLAPVAAWLEDYFAGRRPAFTAPLALAGTDFQRAVWRALLAIPYGATRTYAQLAADVGRPAAVRAVGAANGRNPVGIVVPCHRVVGSDGDLTGYGGGLESKRFLLELEGAPAVRRPVVRRRAGGRAAARG
ncbi:methylated-DNA--[protein]-cysteine S-methyltransferase [Streptomonospora sp. S1-112]|uniref:Methylated-DNA--protein-cysteine methyltransferase n=1 Tax=Streptomonospora mangrovi TaxID=2883123 RepID=A0A9X3SE54_9ACTN|nr:methylated-DNA--[protein]-cysteine S-methyltransferase [Streptomonospora mangrovi]MDA0563400.1 methylated-DNA--[protein]-cysteine S-methyltransferase [Streptomonospora mangrovi]